MRRLHTCRAGNTAKNTSRSNTYKVACVALNHAVNSSSKFQCIVDKDNVASYAQYSGVRAAINDEPPMLSSGSRR